jgi:hypothetical protein
MVDSLTEEVESLMAVGVEAVLLNRALTTKNAVPASPWDLRFFLRVASFANSSHANQPFPVDVTARYLSKDSDLAVLVLLATS